MFFKANPRQLVIDKAISLFGKDAKVRVIGKRGERGVYNIDCYMNDLQTHAQHRDWRKAYKLLAIEVEKLFTRNLGKISLT